MTRFERLAAIGELTLLAITLIITVSLGAAVFYQARNYFIIQRTTSMIERFNQKELVDARERTEEWLRMNEDPKALLDRAFSPKDQNRDPGKNESEDAKLEEARLEAIQTVRSIVLVCNFFQELGTAMNHESLDEKYLWDVFGASVLHYGLKLGPFVAAYRVKKDRQTLMQDFLLLVDKMKELDKKYRN